MKKHIVALFLAMVIVRVVAQENAIPATQAAATQAVAVSAVGSSNETFATLELPAQLPKGYPLRFGLLEFTTSAELLLNLPGNPLGRILAAASNRSMALPLGVSYLNVELTRFGLEYYHAYPGKSGSGMNWGELQQAVLAGQVTHVVQCVVSDVRYAERNFVGYGITTSKTDYSLDLNVIVYDLSRQRVVLTGNFVGHEVQQKPFNRDAFVNDIFQRLLTNACSQAAEAIARAGSVQEDGSAPKIQPVE